MSEMKNEVSVWFDGYTTINVDGDSLHIKGITTDTIADKVPDDLDLSQVNGLDWNILSPNMITFAFYDGGSRKFDADRYNDFIQPYVDLWQAEKDRLEKEEQEEQAEYNKFENRQARALVQLNQDFEKVKERSHIKSSLGFTVDANQTANENVTGLLVTIGDTETVQFCDYHNQFHELTKANLRVLQTEIIANAQNLYQQKWVYRTQIEQCSNNEQLDTVLEGIEFTYMDFTPTDEQA